MIKAADTATNQSIADLVTDIQQALNVLHGYTVTELTNAVVAVGSIYTEFASDAGAPDIKVQIGDGKLVLTKLVLFRVDQSSLNADQLGLADSASGDLQSVPSPFAIEASGVGSQLVLGTAAGPNGELYLAGRVLAHDQISLQQPALRRQESISNWIGPAVCKSSPDRSR